MNFGQLDRQLTLQAPTAPPQNDFGEPAPASFTDVATVWARVQYPQQPGTEVVQADQLTTLQPITFTIRYRPDVATTWQVRYEGQTYLITARAEIGRRQGLLLTAHSRG